VASLKINYESIKELVCLDRKEKIGVKQLNFKRNNKDWTVNSGIIEKSYACVYDKRILFNDFSTLPYGY
jgi:hypothetical protein